MQDHWDKSGRPTLVSRVDAWECDFNGHMNSRFYCRAFQYAEQVARASDGDMPKHWHLRFHGELLSGDPFAVRSFDASSTVRHSATAHVLECEGKLAATALSFGQGAAKDLPALPQEAAQIAFPKGLTGPPITPEWFKDDARLAELGPLEREDTTEAGVLSFWRVMARATPAIHHHDHALGFSPTLMTDQGITRMLVELRVTLQGAALPGTLVRVASRTVSAAGKRFIAAHRLKNHEGTTLAIIECCTLAVDTRTRRAVALPESVLQSPGISSR